MKQFLAFLLIIVGCTLGLIAAYGAIILKRDDEVCLAVGVFGAIAVAVGADLVL